MISWDLGLVLFVWNCCFFMRFQDFLDAARILYKHISFYQCHQIRFLCDHQELACTPKDPPRRVDMKEMCLLFFVRQFIELSTKPFENLLLWNRLKTAYVLWYLKKNVLYELNVCLGTQAWEAGGTTGRRLGEPGRATDSSRV